MSFLKTFHDDNLKVQVPVPLRDLCKSQSFLLLVRDMAMGQKPNRTPSQQSPLIPARGRQYWQSPTNPGGQKGNSIVNHSGYGVRDRLKAFQVS